MARSRLPLWLLLPLAAGCMLALGVGTALVVYHPDAPRAALEPGTSDGPRFEVQVQRPRAGLPLGGILPPAWFGQNADLGSIIRHSVRQHEAFLGRQFGNCVFQSWPLTFQSSGNNST